MFSMLFNVREHRHDLFQSEILSNRLCAGVCQVTLGLTWEPGMCLSWNTEALVVPPALVLRGEGASVAAECGV